jgi:hypothetical protein
MRFVIAELEDSDERVDEDRVLQSFAKFWKFSAGANSFFRFFSQAKLFLTLKMAVCTT